MQEKLPLWRRIIKTALLTLLGVVLLAAFYTAVIMGHPQEDATTAITAKQDQPLLTAMGAPLLIRTADQLGLLLDTFPAPVMAVEFIAAITGAGKALSSVPSCPCSRMRMGEDIASSSG